MSRKKSPDKTDCIVAEDGTRFWYLNDEFHREDGPAIEYPDGSRRWYLNGRFLFGTGEIKL